MWLPCLLASEAGPMFDPMSCLGELRGSLGGALMFAPRGPGWMAVTAAHSLLFCSPAATQKVLQGPVRACWVWTSLSHGGGALRRWP